MKLFELKNVPSVDELETFALSIWKNIKSKIHKLFDEGNPTCLFSTGVVAEQIQKLGWDFYIASGEINDGGHWFIVVQTTSGEYVIDLGDNTCPVSLDTGKITPKIVPLKGSNYKVEDKLTFNEFKQTHN